MLFGDVSLVQFDRHWLSLCMSFLLEGMEPGWTETESGQVQLPISRGVGFIYESGKGFQDRYHGLTVLAEIHTPLDSKRQNLGPAGEAVLFC